MKKTLTFISIICISVCYSQHIKKEINNNNADLYKQILKSNRNFKLKIYLSDFGKYNYQSELEAEFCGKEEDQEGGAIYFKLIRETNSVHAIPFNHIGFNKSKYFDLLGDGLGKKFKIKGRIKTSPYGNVYLRVDKIKPI